MSSSFIHPSLWQISKHHHCGHSYSSAADHILIAQHPHNQRLPLFVPSGNVPIVEVSPAQHLVRPYFLSSPFPFLRHTPSIFLPSRQLHCDFLVFFRIHSNAKHHHYPLAPCLIMARYFSSAFFLRPQTTPKTAEYLPARHALTPCYSPLLCSFRPTFSHRL